MTPYYADDQITLWHGDALGILGRLDDSSVDAVVTDPPYSSGGAFRSDRNRTAKSKYLKTGSDALTRLPEFHGDNRTERGLLMWSTLWLGECWRVAKTGAAIAVFCDWRSLPTFSDALQAGGWTWRGIGVWIKQQGRSRPISGGLWNDTEMILWGSKGPRSTGEALPGTWEATAPDSKSRRHATEKPLTIVRDLVRLAPAGGVVLDPFAGSCTTGVAAREQDRKAILCEIGAEGCEVGARRLREHLHTGADTATVGSAPTLFEQDEP